MQHLKRRLVLEFSKMNGAGNDFIVVDNRFYHFTDEELSDFAVRLCHRRFGIGADGILAYNPPREEGHDFRMRYINADGSIGTMCGNGARCLARFARMAGHDEEQMVFETDAGVLSAHVPADATEPVRIYLSPPRDYQPDRKLNSEEVAGLGPFHYIWTGTEHIVCFVNDIESVPVERLGPAVRRDPALRPAGANVDFVQLPSDGSQVLRARTYEKGVENETLACGTGAVAAALTARLAGHLTSSRIAVEMPGGTLTVGFSVDGEDVRDVYLEGPAEAVFRGTVEV